MSKLNNSRNYFRTAVLSGAAFTALMAGGQAFAQSADGNPAQVEEVVVTGSSIRGVAPVGSALIGVSREQINAVAPTNVKDLLATVPALGNFGTNAEQSTPNRFRTTGYVANIHNLGIYATLTLLNGRRVALTGTEGPFPDASAVPTIAIQRTEVIADGASAIYGSDAVAGVINFIYRKPFNGVETSATYSFDDGTRYEKRDFGIIGGHTWDWGGGGGVMLAYEHSDNKSPLNTDIDFLATGGDQRSRGGRDLRTTTCLAPIQRAIGATGVPTGSTFGSAASGFSTVAADQRCGILSPSTIIGDNNRNAALLTFNQQLTDRVKAWGELNYSHVVSYGIGGRPGITLNVNRGTPFFTAANIAPSIFNSTAPAVSVTVSGNALFPLQGRIKNGSGTVTTAVAGLDIDLGKDWKGTLSLDVSRTRDTSGAPGGEFDTVNLLRLINNPRPGETPFNLFGGASSNTAANIALVDDGSGQRNWGQQGLQALEFKADGPLFELPGGTLRAAVGASFTASQMNQLQLGGSRSPTAGFDQLVRSDHVRQQDEAAYFELNAPLVGAQNAMPGIAELTVSISGRVDNYDKYGTKFNPKYGVVWAPIEDLKLHASYGTNFDAPNVGLLGSLFGQSAYNSNLNATIGYGPFKGTLLNNINQYRIGGTGGGGLTPERAKTYSVGGNYTPHWLPGLNVGLNFYHVNYSNLFFKVNGTDAITNEAFSSLAIFFPTPAQMAQVIATIPPASPVLIPNYDVVLHTEATTGRRLFEGIDYDISYRFTTDSFGAFSVGFSGVQQLKYDQKVLPTQPYQSRLKTTDAVKWKTRTSLGWNYGGLTVSGFLNYTGSYYNVSVSPFQRVKPNKTVDLTAAYEFKDVGISYLKGVTLQARVANVFDKNPPFYDSANGYDGNQASPFPRSYDLTVRAKF